MKRRVLDFGALIALATLVTVVVWLLQPGVSRVLLHVYVLVVGALVLMAVLGAAGESVPRRRGSAFAAARAGPPRQRERLADLERLEREVTLASATAYDLHRRLLPVLREIAAMRLERTGRRLGADTAGRWWELLRPDRPPPENRFAPGIAPRELAALVDDLERM
jgi:hypothetical protein